MTADRNPVAPLNTHHCPEVFGGIGFRSTTGAFGNLNPPRMFTGGSFGPIRAAAFQNLALVRKFSRKTSRS